MKRAFLLFSTLLVLAGQAFAQSPATVTGNLQTLSAGQIQSGSVRFQLSNIGSGNPPSVTGIGIFPRLVQTFTTNSAGAFSVSIWGNDNINPANTIYLVTYLDNAGNSVGPIQYSITGASVNLNTLGALNGVVPPILAPSASLTGPNVFTGSANTFCRLENTRYVDATNLCGWTGSDYGAWVNSAIADLPTITVAGNPFKYGVVTLAPAGLFPITLSTAITLTSPFVSIVGPGENRLYLNCTINGDCFSMRENPFVVTAQGARIGGFTMVGQGAANANAVAMHIGDMTGQQFFDIAIDGFTGTNSACIWFDNQNGFFERNTFTNIQPGKAFNSSGGQQLGCTKLFKFTNSGVGGGGSPNNASFGYNYWWGIGMYIAAGQLGWSFEGTNFVELYSNVIFGNSNGAGGTIFSVTRCDGCDNNFIDWRAESTGAQTGWSIATGLAFTDLGPDITFPTFVSNITNSLVGTLVRPGITVKSGTGLGSYTGTNTSFANVDATNLCQVVVIPKGWKLLVSASGAITSNTAAVLVTAQTSDIGTTCGAGGTTALKAIAVLPFAATTGIPFTIPPATIVGDGLAHAISLQAVTSNVADAWNIGNGNNGATPSLVLTLMPSN